MPPRSAGPARTSVPSGSTSRGCWWSCASSLDREKIAPASERLVFKAFRRLLMSKTAFALSARAGRLAAEAVRAERAAPDAAALLREVDGDARPAAHRRANLPRALEGSRVMATRADFLGRIRTEVGKAAPRASRPRPRRVQQRPVEAAEAVRRQMAERWPDALDRFRQEFEQVAGVFHRARTRRRRPRRRARDRPGEVGRECGDVGRVEPRARPRAAARCRGALRRRGRRRATSARRRDVAIARRRPGRTWASPAWTSPSPRRAR